MAKKIVPNDNVKDFLRFKPSVEQKLVKVEFWEIVGDNPALDPASMAKATICRLIGNSKLADWLKDPGFQAWFFKQNHAKNKIQAAAEDAIDTLLDIMTTDHRADPKIIGSKVKAAEIILRLGGYEPAKQKQIEVLDKDIQKMSEAELETFMIKHGYEKKLLTQEKVDDKEEL